MMKKRFIGIVLLGFLWLVHADAAPIHINSATEMARSFYTVQFASSAKALPEFTCIYPNPAVKSDAGTVPYYIFNVGEDNGFVIVAGDDNAARLILGYSDKGRFEIEGMPENLRSWLDFYAEGVRSAARSTTRRVHAKTFRKAEPVVEPLLGDINYNQDAPYNDLCPIDPQTGKVSYSGCVATALASIARYYGYPEQGKGSISYTTSSRGIELSMDFSKNRYDWENMLEDYNGNISEYTDIQRKAIATLMRDLGYAVRMDYTSSASGAFRDNTIAGIVDYLGFDSIASYRERDLFDDEAQWIALLQSSIDQAQPLYYAGTSAGGGHAFICDGYDEADYFHFNWGWGNLSNGFFSVNNLDPSSLGIGGGTGGGYSNNQGIIHNMLPSGHEYPKDDYFIYSTAPIEPIGRNPNEEYSVTADTLAVKFTGFYNYTMAQFSGSIAFGLFQDGELKQIISKEEQISLPRMASKSLTFTLVAELDGLEDGEYEIWAVSKSDKENAQWNKVYGNKSGWHSDSYIPVSVTGNTYGIVSVSSRLTIAIECGVSRNVSMGIIRNGILLGTTRVSSASGSTLDLRYGIYDFWFHTSEFDTAYVKDFHLTKDTSIYVEMKEILVDPFIRGCSVSENTAELFWANNPPNAENVYPQRFVLYLDSVAIDSVNSKTTEYLYQNLTKGKHTVGVQSVFRTGRSGISTRSITIKTDLDNETPLQQMCRLSPNPSKDGRFTVTTNRNCTLQVSTLNGNILFERELNGAGSHEVDMSGYASGMYFFRISAGQETITLKALLK